MVRPTPSALSVALWLCLSLAATGAFGQSDLLMIDGKFSRVRYTPGYLDRANHVLMRCDVVAEELKKTLKQQMALNALVVTREQWERADLSRPYGLPLAVSLNTVAVAGLGDPGTVAMWERWLGSDLPKLPGSPLQGSHAEVSSLSLGDIILQREIAGLFVDQFALTRDSVWVRGVVSHLIALSLFERFERGRVPEVVTTWNKLAGQLPILVDLAGGAEKAPVEAMLGDEAIYFKAAYSLYQEMGRKAVSKVVKTARKSSGVDAEAMLELFPSLLVMLPPSAKPVPSSVPVGTGAI